jgi:anti-sigma factor RsiW
MSGCGRTRSLDALVARELPVTAERDLRAHAAGCARCRHELNWLEAEVRLFRQRSSREEVAELWEGVSERSGMRTERPWARVIVTVAAMVVMIVGAGQLARHRPSSPAPEAPTDMAAAESNFGWSGDGEFSSVSDEPCSRLPQGQGFACSPTIPASFLASR